MSVDVRSREEFYETIADEFDGLMNMYDTNRRVEVIFEDFLGGEDLRGKTLLDGGCGTGWFSRAAAEAGAEVTSLDISPSLVNISCGKATTAGGVVGSVLELPFENDTFDFVISSEVIEHTPDPHRATEELIRVLKPQGKICITVPNRSFWYFSVVVANLMRLRKYKGHENWVHYGAYRRFLESSGVELLEYKGLHLFPFVLGPLNRLLHRLDRLFDRRLGRVMVNISAFGRKLDPARYEKRQS